MSLRPIIPVALLVLAASSCLSDAVALGRGPLGPARYEVDLEVTGDATVREEAVSAELEIVERPRGATLRLVVEGDEPLVAEVDRLASGRLTLDTVQGVSPPSAGEADLASLVTQLDPPLPGGRVALRDAWTRTRRITTDTLDARLRSRLRTLGFRRVAGHDSVEIGGEVSGRLRTEGPAGSFSGRVSGETRFTWLVDEGRLGTSETVLRWSISDSGDLVVRTSIRPRDAR